MPLDAIVLVQPPLDATSALFELLDILKNGILNSRLFTALAGWLCVWRKVDFNWIEAMGFWVWLLGRANPFRKGCHAPATFDLAPAR